MSHSDKLEKAYKEHMSKEAPLISNLCQKLALKGHDEATAKYCVGKFFDIFRKAYIQGANDRIEIMEDELREKVQEQ